MDKPQTPPVSIFDVNQMGTAYWMNTMPHAWAMAQAKIAMFICPSDTPYSKPDPTIVTLEFDTTPEASSGDLGAAGSVLGKTNYLGVAGYIGHVGIPEYDYYQGVFYDRSKVDFRDITDGAAIRSCSGKRRATPARSHGWGWGFWRPAMVWTRIQTPSAGGSIQQRPCGGGPVLSGRRSVHSLSTEIDFQLFVNLSAIADSAVVQVP